MVSIMGIIVAVSAPSLVRSTRGNRLRTAVRSVVTAGRYARSMAVLQQREYSLVFDLDNGAVSVAGELERTFEKVGMEYVEITGTAANPFAVERDGTLYDPVYGGLKTKTETGTEKSFEGRHTEGKVVVKYRSNGRCMPYIVRLSDNRNNAVEIEVDMLSSVETRSIMQ